MKKLFVVVGVLSLVAVSFRSASAQSAAPTSSEPDTTTASGSKGAASLEESSTINSERSDRLASATPAGPASEKPNAEAFIDLNRVMKEAAGFNEQLLAMKGRIQNFDRECREQQTKLNALQVELQAASEASLRRQLEEELAHGKAKLQSEIAETKKQFMAEEARICSDVYDQVRAVTAAYAKEHGIRRVTRSQSVARTEDKADGTDRTAMLQRINRPIIYLETTSESPTDITDAIMQRLIATSRVP